jgi:hypothetical protein
MTTPLQFRFKYTIAVNSYGEQGTFWVKSIIHRFLETRESVSKWRHSAPQVRGHGAATISRNNPVGEAFMKRTAILGSAAAVLAVLSAPAQAQFRSALQESEATATETARAQQQIDQLDDQTASLLNDYRANLKQLEAARRYNASLNRNIEAQERQLVRLREDIENVEGLQRAMQPLMEDMVATFGELVSADLPFLATERTERAARLEGVLANPEMSAAQRYRLIVEAYQIEGEYGRTIRAYDGTVNFGGAELTGEFLGIGRVALMFKTPDDSTLLIYDTAQRDWVNLDKGKYLQDVKYALRMAKEQTAPDIFFAPVKPPVQAQ